MSILTQTPVQVNAPTWAVLNDESDLTSVPDGVYEFDDPCDRFVVVLGGQAVNWATHQGTAFTQYTEALRVRREHYSRGNSWGGEPVTYESEADDYGLPPQW